MSNDHGGRHPGVVDEAREEGVEQKERVRPGVQRHLRPAMIRGVAPRRWASV